MSTLRSLEATCCFSSPAMLSYSTKGSITWAGINIIEISVQIS